MSQANADRNLLFGILALQLDFISRDQLVAAMHAWVLDKHKALGDILCAQGALAHDNQVLLESLVQKHLRQHHDDPQASLAAVSPLPLVEPEREQLSGAEVQVGWEGRVRAAIRQLLFQLDDPDVQASLAHVTTDREPEADAYPTRSYSVGTPTSAGLRFRILRPHAKGGLGQVSVALDEELHREVALKEIQERHADDANSRARFLLEAEITGGLEHPGIVPVYGLGTYADGRPFYAMRFIKGDSLKDAITRFHASDPSGVRKPPEPDSGGLRPPLGERTLAFRKLLGRFVDVCNALAYAHSRGVLHRDLKPGNVMLGNYGETLVVDWGLAKVIARSGEPGTLAPGEEEATLRPASASGSAATQMGSALGTPAYMAPEQAAGRLDQLGSATDVYGLGATLYCLLTGKAPFEDREAGEVLRKVQKGDFPPPRQVQRDVPPALEAICLKAMALRPADRYPSAKALADDIEHWLADEPVAAYAEPWSARLGRWARRHRSVVTGAAALLLTAVVALAISTILIGQEQQKTEKALRQEQEARKERALAQVEALLSASPQAVPALLAGLGHYREDVLPRLRQLWAQPEQPGDRARRTRVGLALLPDDASVKDQLYTWMLQTDDPQEMLLLRDGLRPYGAELAEALWQKVDAAQTPAPERFRALVVLASFDPESPRWATAGKQAVEQFLAANPLHLGLWKDALWPIRASLIGPLRAVFRGQKQADKQLVAANILADYADDRPDTLADLAADAEPQQYAVLLPVLQKQRNQIIPFLRKELEKPLPPEEQVTGRDALAKRQAQAAVALLQLGQDAPVWPLLRHSPDPSRRTYLQFGLGRLGTDPMLLVRRLKTEPDISARRALLLALGEYTAEQLPADQRPALLARLLKDYEQHPDPGLHSAAEWLLRRWGHTKELRQIEDRLRGQPAGKRHWYVTKQGHTLAVVRGPVEFLMGSPAYEPGRADVETLHRRHIPRSFAIATKEVTVAQFRRFLKDHPEVRHVYTKKYSPKPDGPMVTVTWFEAAQYCNWLSEQEGIPENQWCYPKDIREGMELPPDYLRRTGYRLPTEAEWEYACRAGAATSRFYGTSEVLLKEYAWFNQNSKEHAWPAGQLRPNDLGLFDVLGNAWEWCQDRLLKYPSSSGNRVVLDREDRLLLVKDQDARIVRGGTFYFPAQHLRSADRDGNQPSGSFYLGGLRVVRTYP
jgi:formylglycine-generating enzyme required for sulfatase activity/serine/threonine protein kinase